MIKVLTLFLYYIALASSRKQRRIANGRVVSQAELEHSFPFMVSVAANCDERKQCQACSGTLVAPDKVVLASHCFCKPGFRTLVYFNSTEYEGGREVEAALGNRMPFDCRSSKIQASHDIAVLFLLDPVTDIKPVKILCEKINVGRTVTMIGYGSGGADTSKILRLATASLIECHPKIVDAYCIDENLVEKGRPSTTSGDSGGPLLVHHSNGVKMIGVSSGSVDLNNAGCNGREKSDLMLTWTSVEPYCDWF